MKNLKEYFPDLTENEVAKGINQALTNVDENLSYKDFAIGVAAVLKDEYGTHNFAPFMEVLHAELGITESLNEGEEEQLADEFSDKFNVKVSSMMWGNNGKIEIITQNDIQIADMENMIQWIEDKGYKVDRDQSENLFDYDDDRYFYPRIQFSK
jgi:hypothetical protein